MGGGGGGGGGFTRVFIKSSQGHIKIIEILDMNMTLSKGITLIFSVFCRKHFTFLHELCS